MTSRKRRSTQAPPATKGPGAADGAGAHRPLLLVAGVVAVLGIGAAWVWLGGQRGAGTANPGAAMTVGPGGACQGTPHFVAGLGTGPRAMIGTSVPGVKGLAVLDPDKPRDQGGIFQHPSWDDAGALGPYAYDAEGNLYVAPAPLDNVQDNPVALQNRIYKVDTDSMEMTLLVDLPPGQPPSGANPFGVIGLAYDCSLRQLFAASVAGSTAGQEAGRIFRVDPAAKAVAVLQDGVDAFGLATFNGVPGKRLYYGLARQPELYSVALDGRGAFADSPRRELSLAELPDGSSDKIRRIRFPAGQRMTLHAYDFTYSLQVASERQERLFQYAYDAAADAWSRVAEGQ